VKSGKKIVAVGGVAAVVIIIIASSNIFVQNNAKTTVVQNSTNSARLKVVASFFPMYEFARNVGGDRADVRDFIPIGEEPHGWEPPTQAILDVQNSQLFVYNGAGIEAFIPSFLSEGNFPNTTFVKASEGIAMLNADVQHMDKNEAAPVISQGGKDPHVWNDPILAEQEVRNIANAMEKADPANAKYYENNTVSYIAKLSKLDQDIRSGFTNCKTHTFVSFHNAFNYFSQRYNLTNYWISGIAPEAEITPQDLARVENIAKTNNVKIIFAEDVVDPKLAETLAADVDAQVKILSPLEGINETERKEGITFIDKWYQNLANLKEAMGCQ